MALPSDDSVKVLAFISDNVKEPKGTKPDHASTLVSVAKVEEDTGLAFANLPASLKAKVFKLWPVDEDNFLTGCANKKMRIAEDRVVEPQ